MCFALSYPHPHPTPAATEQARQSLTAEELARATERVAAAKAERTSWWSQDVGEGIELAPSVAASAAASAFPAPEPQPRNVGALLQRCVMAWAEDAARAAAAAASAAAASDAVQAAPPATLAAASPGETLPMASAPAPTAASATFQEVIDAAAPGAMQLAADAEGLLAGAAPSDAHSAALFSAVVQAVAAFVSAHGVALPPSLHSDLGAVSASGALPTLVAQSASAVAAARAEAAAAEGSRAWDDYAAPPAALPFLLLAGSGELCVSAAGGDSGAPPTEGCDDADEEDAAEEHGAFRSSLHAHYGAYTRRAGEEPEGSVVGASAASLALLATLTTSDAYRELAEGCEGGAEEGPAGGAPLASASVDEGVGPAAAAAAATGVAQQLFADASTCVAAELQLVQAMGALAFDSDSAPRTTPASPLSSRLAPSLLRVFSPITSAAPAAAGSWAGAPMAVQPSAVSLLLHAANASPAPPQPHVSPMGAAAALAPPAPSPDLLSFSPVAPSARVSPRPLAE